MTTQNPNSTLLVERLQAQDEVIKRLNRQLDGAKDYIKLIEQNLASVRGSCKAQGEDLRKIRHSSAQYFRAISWMIHHLNLGQVGMPGWVRQTLRHVLDVEQRPLVKKEVANG